MFLEISDYYGEKFKAALEKSGEDEKIVLERIIKSYVYDVFSRHQESYYALETLVRLPKVYK